MTSNIHFTIPVLAALIISVTALSQPAEAQGCPDGSTKVGEQQDTLPDGTTEVTSICKPVAAKQTTAPVVRNLAEDPDAERQSTAQLRVVDGQIAFLQKAIALLGSSNPEWERERKHLDEDMNESISAATWEGVNLLSLGLSELTKMVAHSQFSAEKAKAIVAALQKPLSNLPAEETRLNRVLETTKDPEVSKAIVKYLDALHGLRDAQRSNDAAKTLARARDAADALNSQCELMKLRPPQSEDADALYMSSAFLGSIAIIFVAEGPEAVAAAAGSAASSVGVGGRALVNIWEEHGRMAALDQNASDRNRLKVDLGFRLSDLQKQHDDLSWAAQHAKPMEGNQ